MTLNMTRPKATGSTRDAVRAWCLVFAVCGLFAATFLWGCSDDDNGNGQDGGTDAQTDGAADAGIDAGDDGGTVQDPCVTLGLQKREFVDATDNTDLYALAADFTVSTTAGNWNLSENWSGCEVYLVVLDWPRQNDPDFGYGMWEDAGDVRDLFQRTPPNVHYLFASVEREQIDRNAALNGLRTLVDDALGDLTSEEQAWWEQRVHYVRDRAFDLEGWLGQILIDPRWGVGIDRFQRIRYIGSFGAPNHYNQSLPWPFGHNLSMAANEAVYYNYEADREERLEAQAAVVVPVWDATPLAANGGGWFLTNVQLPDAGAMAGFDTMELDLSLTCVGPGEYGWCPAWDYNVNLNLCETVDATQCNLEVGHWITSYHREGRWVHDVSGLLPLVAAGGEHRFSFFIQDPWEVTLSLRFSNGGKPDRPSETHPLYYGTYNFNPTYNDNFTPVQVDIPADAQRVELVTAITGHGMAMPGNCAEFCNTDHHFMVNGTDNLRDFPTTADNYGCMAQVADGTVPNQYGTWWFGRGGWCPGKHVAHTANDITFQVNLGASNTFAYEGYYQGNPYQGDSWVNIHLASWVVVYR